MKIELRNYRAFDDSNPAVWEPQDAFVAIVGLNNSGKSSLLRFIYEARPAFEVFDQPSQNNNLGALKGSAIHCPFKGVADFEEAHCNRNTRDLTATLTLDAPHPDEDIFGVEPEAIRFRWRRPASMTIEILVAGSVFQPDGWTENFEVTQGSVGGAELRVDLRRFKAAIRDLSRAIYLGPFRNAVNVGGTAEYYDLQIGEQFIAAWDQIKTGNNRAQNRAAIAVERELQGIFGLSKLEINAAPGNATLQIIADDEPYQLQEQGAGLTQFILVMALVATRRPSYILIDEPELNLHPALQLDFLTTLAGYCERGVAFATHSIGLARSVGQEVYSVRSLPDGGREVRPLEATRNYVQFLGELSLSGYSELGFNRVLLVEGTTEVPTIQRWLRLYGIEHEVVLLPLGGGSLINASSSAALAEISRITDRVYVVIDSERTSADAALDLARQGFVDTCSSLGFYVHVLERRAIENYFTDAAVKDVKGEKYRALGEFEALMDVSPSWGKNENWRIAAAMTRGDLDATDLGDLFARLVSGPDPKA